MISVDNVSLYFTNLLEKPVQVLRKVSMQIEDGEFVAIVGASGCGKTTLLNVIAGIIEPTLGTVVRDGRKVESYQQDYGYMLARAALLPWRTAVKNVELPLEVRGVQKRERRIRAEELLNMVGLGDAFEKYPSQLSQGMRQRVALARTLAINPTLWLLDEPFSALDAQTRLSVQTQFLELREKTKSTVILVTHDLEEAAFLADRIIVLGTKPGYIKKIVDVPYARPRNIEILRTKSEFAELQNLLWRSIRE